jgi:thiosulfate/3-mercaptopyruvate sulfurtransferase
MIPALISAADLAKLLPAPHVKLLDASYKLPAFPAGIPGAIDFDIDDVADPYAPFAHTVPPAHIFAEKAGALGIGNDDLVVVYDRAGIAMAAARAWWMFRLFGHDNVRILDGGLPAWVRGGFATAPKNPPPSPKRFAAHLRPELLRSTEEMKNNLGGREFAILDARDAARFSLGHIPGALSAPYSTLLNPDATLKPKEALREILPVQDSIICSCGSGVTACVIALSLFELGHKNAAVYDGSWTEWSADPALPQERGA